MCIQKMIFLSHFYGSRYSFTKAFCIAFFMTFFSMFDVPVFWPILLCYWIVLFVLTMRRQIAHMIKYKYVPFNLGKQVSFKTFFFFLPMCCNIFVEHNSFRLLLFVKMKIWFVLLTLDRGMVVRNRLQVAVTAVQTEA